MLRDNDCKSQTNYTLCIDNSILLIKHAVRKQIAKLAIHMYINKLSLKPICQSLNYNFAVPMKE